MIGFGFGEVFGAFFIGWVVDTWGSKVSTYVNAVICALMTGITIWFLQTDNFSALAYIMTFIWGFQDSAINAHL